ncbi:MAG: hypothetical protein HY062_04035 [Bacteroidetes bacterium]|nr:hypothetical protein [Bacteroidota bacterium]
MIQLECKKVVFYSELDEISFVERINSISCIQSWEGINTSIILHIKTKTISDNCLRELISLFHRYKVEMSQLSLFLNKKNKTWFMDNEKAFWYKQVFKNYLLIKNTL